MKQCWLVCFSDIAFNNGIVLSGSLYFFAWTQSLYSILFCSHGFTKETDDRLFQRWDPLPVPTPCCPTHLHLKAHTAPSDSVAGTGSWPQVCKALNCERVATTPVSGHLEVEVAVICGEKSLELADVLKVPREKQAQTFKAKFPEGVNQEYTGQHTVGTGSRETRHSLFQQNWPA